MKVQITDELRQSEIRETAEGYIVTARKGVVEFKKSSDDEWQFDVYTKEGQIGVVNCVGQCLRVTNTSGAMMMDIVGRQVLKAPNAIRCSIVAEHILDWYKK